MLLLDVVSKKEVQKVPFWFMRQAGRYLPEYMEIRNKSRENGMNFLGMCYDVETASEITLQPIRRFNMSAAIVFSDILVVPHAIGWNVEFQEGIGPVLEKFQSEEDLKLLSRNRGYEKYEIVGNVIANVRSKLAKDKALIGFSGCPFTLACYMIDGGGSKDFIKTQKMLYENEHLFEHLIEVLADSVGDYLEVQINHGANIVQLFDSHAGLLHGEMYEKYIINQNRKITNRIKQKYPNIPVICFPKNSGILYQHFANNVPCDVISLDNSASCGFFSNAIESQVLQGNLNNYLLCYGKEKDIIASAEKIIHHFRKGGKSFIFNLSHGMLKDAKMQNVEALVDFLQQYQ